MLKKRKGFTITELVVSVAILSSLACFCSPSISQLISGIQTKATISVIIADLELAKMTAIKECCVVAVSFSSNGYKTFIDNGEGAGIQGDGQHQDGEKVLGENTLPKHLALTNNFISSRILFRPTASVWPGTLTVVNSKGSSAAIILSRVGRIRTE